MHFCDLQIFSKSTFSKKILSGIPAECLAVWLQIRSDKLSGLIWIQNVCKGSTLDKQRICVITQLKSTKKQLNETCAYRKAILTIGMQLHAMSLRTIWSISFPIWVINKCQSGIDFFLLESGQYNYSFMNKISVPRPVFRGITL